MMYLYLGLAIGFEVGWAVAMKLSCGLSRLWPTVATVVMYVFSLVFLALATKKIDVGIGYAIWAGSGVALIAVAGIVHFREPVTIAKVVSLGLIVAGIVGLQVSGSGH